MIECKTYKFKEEFCKELGIPMNQPNRRKSELLIWLTNFYDYELLQGRPLLIKINEIYDMDYVPLPRKLPSQEELNNQKKQDYNNYVIENLPKELTPMSKTKMSRDAINDFGHAKYGHKSPSTVARTYVGPAMEEHGIKTTQRFWCWAKTYEVLNDDVLFEWREILAKWKCTEKEVYNAFCKKQTLNNDEEIVRLEGAFKAALNEFRDKYFDGVVLVPKWRIASAAEKAQKQEQ